MKISSKTNIFFFIGSIVAVGFTVLISFVTVSGLIEERVAHDQLDDSRFVLREIDNLIKERIIDGRLLTKEGLFKHVVAREEVSENHYLEDYNAIQDRIDIVTEDIFMDIWIIEDDGTILFSSCEDHVSKSLEEVKSENLSGSFSESIQGREFKTGRTTCPCDESPVYLTSFPIYSSIIEGKVQGVLIIAFDWKQVDDILFSDEHKTMLYLMNEKGVVISTNNGDFDYSPAKNNYLENINFQSVNQGKEGSFIESSIINEEEEVLLSYIPQTGNDEYVGDRWVLLAETEKKVAFSGIPKALLKIATLIVPTIMVAAFLVWIFINNSAIKPIIHLTDIVREISKGNTKLRSDIKSEDEIGELSNVFNKMNEDIQKSKEELEYKVEKRTKELSEKLLELNDAKVAILNVLEDVQEEKEIVNQEREKTDRILDSIGDGVFVIDRELKITLFNGSASRISGYSQKEAIGKRYYEVLQFSSENEEKISNQFIIDVFKYRKVTTMGNEMQLLKKDGSKISVADSAAPLFRGNEIVGVVVVFRDFSKERRIDKAKTEFVSLASHQLRTPLSAINWYTEMVMSGDAGKVTKDQKDYLNEIYRSSRRMTNLVNALLNVSRIELGTLAIQPASVKISGIIRDVLLELKPHIRKKELKIKEKYEKNEPKIKVDNKLIRVVFQNILSNAVKYTPNKGTISISLKKKKEDVLVSISDTGYGIPKADQSKIFTKLFRASNAVERETDGTGLGLYVAKNVIDQSGGRIWFESIENKGTTFYISIPLKGMKKKKGTKGLSSTGLIQV